MEGNLKARFRQQLGLSRIVFAIVILAIASGAQNIGEAPAGFDNKTNGAISQDDFDSDSATFSKVDGPSDGLGPVFNAESCVACHFSGGAIGGSSQIAELRAGRTQNGQFVPANVVLATGDVIKNRSLINQRSTCADAQSRVPQNADVVATRLSLSTLGDGFVEAVPDDTFKRIADDQNRQTEGRIHGEWLEVAVAEAPGATAVGRFGWKTQQASLLSFSADAYLNEMGVSTPLAPNEATTACQYPGMTDPNDNMDDIQLFAAFMRATRAPSRDAALAVTLAALAGGQIFSQIGCATCHVQNMVTAPAGTVLLGGQYTVPAAIGGKVFHPYSDFLLHDVGTGDGIVQQADHPETASKLRTMPLWGLRTRPQLMHDGLSPTYDHAILRHRGEALEVIRRYWGLTNQQKQFLYTFLRSL